MRDEQTGNPLKLAAWWIPAKSAGGGPATRTILLIHGYADAKVGAIAWAPTLHALGWNILAIDLRAHGESGGKLSTAGYWERHDVVQLIDQFRAQRPRETATLVLFETGAEKRCDAVVVIGAAKKRATDRSRNSGR